MEREIKFRVWDSISKKMYQWCEINHLSLDSFNLEHYTLMQYTGLKDKNEVEIYEGDICKTTDDWEEFGFQAGEINEVIFQFGGFRLKPKNKKARGFWIEDGNDLEVLGNIHQNPDLL